ncbi:signal peptidase I [Salinifilum aidingensis]
MADVMRSGGPTGPEEPSESDERGSQQDDPARERSDRKKRKNAKKGSFWRELPILIGTALVLTVLIQVFLARVYLIPSQSMEETLHGCPGCNNDRVLVDKVTYRFSDPQPGDVVVFRGPQPWVQGELSSSEPTNPVVSAVRYIGSLIGFGSPSEKDFVKRVIATGGQTVECCDPQNRVMVDGEPLEEPYIHWEGEPHQRSFGPVTVPPGHLWMMGDNRNNSADSRLQGGGGANGAVPVDNVIGKAQVIVLPPTRWQGIPEPNPQERAQAMDAPAWQGGAPLAAGAAAAFPTVWAGRRLGGVVTRGVKRERERH